MYINVTHTKQNTHTLHTKYRSINVYFVQPVLFCFCFPHFKKICTKCILQLHIIVEGKNDT